MSMKSFPGNPSCAGLMHGSSRLIALAAIAVFCAIAAIAADEKAPGLKEPASPSVEFRGREESGQSWVRAALVRARGERLEGELLLAFAALDLETVADNKPAKRSVPLAEIASIEFTRWQGYRRRKNEYAFYPALVRVTLADKSVVASRANLRMLYTLRLRTGDRVRTYYSYFFDYREKDAWKNSGEKGMDYPQSNPNADTVVRIELVRASPAGPLDMIFKMLEKK